MARKKQDTVATEEVKKPVRKRKSNSTTVRKSRAAEEIEAAAEEELSTGVSKVRIKEDCTVDVSNLQSERRSYYRQIASALNEKDMASISSYGTDLQRAMDTYSSEFLKQSFASSGIDSAGLVTDLLGELRKVDIDDLEAPSGFKRFLQRVPIIKSLILTVEGVKDKYESIEKNIDSIVGKLQASRQIAIRDNNLLQKQFENNCDYVDQLEDLIIAGKLKSEEVGAQLEAMRDSDDEYENYEISDVEEFKNALDKRITDLIALRYAFKQSLMQIRIIQRTNIMQANNTETQIALTIPQWKNQLSLAVALLDQKKAYDVSSMVADTTNELFKKNAEMLKTQSIAVAKAGQRNVIDVETLEKTTQDLIATIDGVRKVQDEGAKKRAEAEARIAKLEKEMKMKSIGVTEAAKRVVAKEFKMIDPIATGI